MRQCCSNGLLFVGIFFSVLDDNDNSPSFDNASYSFIVAENTAQLVGLGVSASDIDLGSNMIITYSILGGNDENAFILGEQIVCHC